MNILGPWFQVLFDPAALYFAGLYFLAVWLFSVVLKWGSMKIEIDQNAKHIYLALPGGALLLALPLIEASAVYIFAANPQLAAAAPISFQLVNGLFVLTFYLMLALAIGIAIFKIFGFTVELACMDTRVQGQRVGGNTHHAHVWGCGACTLMNILGAYPLMIFGLILYSAGLTTVGTFIIIWMGPIPILFLLVKVIHTQLGTLLSDLITQAIMSAAFPITLLLGARLNIQPAKEPHWTF